MFEGYSRYYNLIHADKPYKEEAEFVYNWADKPKTILEIGCGTGNYTRYLAEKAKVVGVDPSKDMLNEAWRHPNIRYYTSIPDVTEEFDCVLALFNVIGYVGFFELDKMMNYLPLKSGYPFIFDVWDAKQGGEQITIKDFAGGYRLAVPHRLDDRLLRIDLMVILTTKLKNKLVSRNHLLLIGLLSILVEQSKKKNCGLAMYLQKMC